MNLPKTPQDWCNLINQNINGCYVKLHWTTPKIDDKTKPIYKVSVDNRYLCFHFSPNNYNEHYICDKFDINKRSTLIQDMIVIPLPGFAPYLTVYVPLTNQIRLNKLKKIYELT